VTDQAGQVPNFTTRAKVRYINSEWRDTDEIPRVLAIFENDG